MHKRFSEEEIQAYLEHSLSNEQRRDFDRALTAPEMQRELSAYRAIHTLEQHVTREEAVLEEDLCPGVLARIYAYEAEQSAVTSEAQQVLPQHSWQSLYYGVQAVNCLLLFCLLMLANRQPQQLQAVAAEEYALVSLEVPVEAAMLRQSQRADLKVAFAAAGQEQRRELVRFAAIDAVQAVEGSAMAQARIYLRVPAERLRDVQLALLLGQLELSPLPLRLREAAQGEQLHDPLGRPISLTAAETPAVLYLARDAGKGTERLAYREGAWVPEVPLHITAF